MTNLTEQLQEVLENIIGVEQIEVEDFAEALEDYGYDVDEDLDIEITCVYDDVEAVAYEELEYRGQEDLAIYVDLESLGSDKLASMEYVELNDGRIVEIF